MMYVTIYATHAHMLMIVMCSVLAPVHVLVLACFDRHERGDCLELFLRCPLHCKPWPWQVLLLAMHSIYTMVPFVKPAMLDTYTTCICSWSVASSWHLYATAQTAAANSSSSSFATFLLHK